uniref:leucine-rich repeat protein n=1 Tax=Alistipes megaguti TaxID=2364787 RepID=UPI000EFAA4A5|nr:leucine-rich repeat protein [Alistipes megaguti]
MKKLLLLTLFITFLGGCSKSDTEGNADIDDSNSETIITSEIEAEALGGEFIIKTVCSNMETDSDWIIINDIQWSEVCIEIKFEVKPNSTPEKREGKIFIYDYNYQLYEIVTIKQAEPSPVIVHVPQKGALATTLQKMGLNIETILSLKITGELNLEDFLFIKDQLPYLGVLDISEVNISTLPNKALYNSKNISSVILPNTLITIGEYAFSKNGLTSIEIPASVETIEQAAFNNCSKLATVTFEKGSHLKAIGNYAFEHCPITSIEIPASVETIEQEAFKGCSSLTTVTFEKGSQLKTIGGGYNPESPYYYGAFSDCAALTSIEIPASVETIEATAFKNCSKLATVTFEKGSNLKTIGGGLSSHYYVYYYGAFSDCAALTSIEIPASVETIEEAAFYGCSKLATVTFEKGSNLKTIGGSCHYYSDYYYGAFSDCPITSIEIPASVETIEMAAFKNCSKLATVTFEKGSNLKTIGGGYSSDSYYSDYYYGAFSDCPITSIEIPASVETIEASVFSNCSSLATVTFENGSKLKTIGKRAFIDLDKLMIVDMSACTQVKTIGEYAFHGDSELRLFKIGTETPPTCEKNAFDWIDPYAELKVPSGCTYAYKREYGWNEFRSITELDE